MRKWTKECGLLVHMYLAGVAGFVIVLAFCASCGAGEIGALMPVLEETLRLAEEAAKAHGADLSKAPVKCEQEYAPETKKLLLMCEADLSSQSK